MKVTVVAIAAIALTGCATYSHEDLARKDDSWKDVVVARPTTTSTMSVLAGEEEKVRPSCEEQWPGDWQMLALCVRSNTTGIREVRSFLEVHNIQDGDTTPEAEIFAACSRKWRNRHGRPDWQMIALCVRQQSDGYRQLYPGGAWADNHLSPKGCAALENDAERLECFDELSAPQRAVEVAPDTGMWEILEETDPLDDSTTVILSLKESEGWGILGPILFLRCMSGETEVLVVWGWGVDLGSEDEDEDIDVVSRVGSAKTVTQPWVLSTDSTATFFPGDTRALIESLMMEDRFVAQVEPPNSNPITAVFELHGIEAAVAPLRRACGW